MWWKPRFFDDSSERMRSFKKKLPTSQNIEFDLQLFLQIRDVPNFPQQTPAISISNFQDGEAWMLPVPASQLGETPEKKTNMAFLELLGTAALLKRQDRTPGSWKNHRFMGAILHFGGMFLYAYPILCKFGWNIGTLLHAALLNLECWLKMASCKILKLWYWLM